MKNKKYVRKIWKDAFKFNINTWKSGGLNVLFILISIFLLFMVASTIQVYDANYNFYEQELSKLYQDESLTQDQLLLITQDYYSALKDLEKVVIIFVTAFLLLTYILYVLLKTLEYRLLLKIKKKTHKFKRYVLAGWHNLKNTLPLFLVLWGLIYLVYIFLGVKLITFILCILLMLIYWICLPILMSCSVIKKKFKITWMLFWSILKKSMQFIPSLILFTLAIIICLLLLILLGNLATVSWLSTILGMVLLVFISLSLVIGKKYLFNCVKHLVYLMNVSEPEKTKSDKIKVKNKK